MRCGSYVDVCLSYLLSNENNSILWINFHAAFHSSSLEIQFNYGTYGKENHVNMWALQRAHRVCCVHIFASLSVFVVSCFFFLHLFSVVHFIHYIYWERSRAALMYVLFLWMDRLFCNRWILNGSIRNSSSNNNEKKTPNYNIYTNCDSTRKNNRIKPIEKNPTKENPFFSLFANDEAEKQSTWNWQQYGKEEEIHFALNAWALCNGRTGNLERYRNRCIAILLRANLLDL